MIAGTAEEHLHAAEQALQAGHARDGLHEAQQALITQPENARAHALIGLAHTLMGDDIEARESLKRAAEFSPRDSRMRYISYLALARLGDRQAALGQLTYFAELEPNNPKAQALLKQMGGPVSGLPPLPAPQVSAVWYDGGGHATMDSSDFARLKEGEEVEPPPGPDVVVCPECEKRTFKGWVCKFCGANLPRPG